MSENVAVMPTICEAIGAPVPLRRSCVAANDTGRDDERDHARARSGGGSPRPVGDVVAVRASSVLIASVIGWRLLHEQRGRIRTAAGLIVSGLVLLVAAR